MKKKYVLFFLIFSLTIFGQKKDTLAKYSAKQLERKSKVESKSYETKRKIYLEAILKRDISDSLRADTNFNLGDYYIDSDFEKSYFHFLEAIKYYEKIKEEETAKACLYYIANLHAFNGEYDTAFDYCEQAKKINEKLGETYLTLPFDQFINYSISEIHAMNVYFIIGDLDKSIEYSKEILRKNTLYTKNHKNLTKSNLSELLYDKSRIYGYLTINYCYKKKLDSAYYYLQRNKKIQKDETETWFLEPFYLIIKGDYDKAIAKINGPYQKFILPSKTETFFSYYYLALCYKGKKDYKKSLEYCELALKKPFHFISFTNFELELYKLAAENAKKSGNSTKQNEYSKKFAEGASKINYQKKAEFMSKLYDLNEVDPLVFDNKEKESKINYLLIGLAVLLVLGSGIFAWSLYKRAKDIKNFQKIIAELEAKAKEPKAELEEEAEEINSLQEIPNKWENPLLGKISAETEQMILKKLSNFERKEKFKNPDLTLISLSADFGTNTNYISNIIKNHKNKSFSLYINELRINYIIDKLQNDPAYLSYKISYLAEDCGFKSHSVFIKTFQQIKKITPSKFIELLSENKKLKVNTIFDNQN